MTRRLIALAVVTACWLFCGIEAQAATKRYAVIVAHTQDLEKKLAPLEYADDDGARYYELFGSIADDVAVFTVLDEDSQGLYPKVAAQAKVPSKKNVIAGLNATFARIKKDVASGLSVEFSFVLVGHGQVGAGGEGYVSLLDAPFTRTDLFREVLAKSPATTNHVIIDACNSYFLVHRRGGGEDAAVGPSRKEALKQFLVAESLEQYPNTGVLLSTSSEKESHEWSVYGAGVFSHQLRSALSGAADVNRDGVVEYSEVAAFVAAANLRVDDPKARVELFWRAPAMNLSQPLVSLRESHFKHWLRLPKGVSEHMYVEDARGVRVADIHPSGEGSVLVGLPDSPRVYLRSNDGRRELRLSLGMRTRIDVNMANMTSPRLAGRGAIEESYRLKLYAEPYGPGFYKGFIANGGGRAVDMGIRTWLPGSKDAVFVDSELRRLNEEARSNEALRARLHEATPRLVEALEHGRYEPAASLLEAIEAVGP